MYLFLTLIIGLYQVNVKRSTTNKEKSYIEMNIYEFVLV